ncbi:leucine--tRNA ligase [Pseudonocardia sp.]|jgi:leucyl-tRNA synthetase|uniref:leucine--tRNA ligase n=1 Tax=Pseudonocardia sp. TaxID=60912 RepID=UPI00260D56F6|nr:leucine--tRNA ligase [Pseudonocardia sp.]MCW2717327.1 leucyl-tRNA synthetase [Pseudonocardia sp.]MDT7614918.1 leucyl-tRNA synthetase [Pseudonocardiales bacterium]
MSTDTTTDASDTTGGDTLPFRYNAALAARIEKTWQDRWETEGTFHTPNPSGPMADPDAVGGSAEDPDRAGRKVYLMDMFPYPSGSGLHVGHPLGFIGTDVLGRYLRMNGRTVLHAMGFDAFGLPAEQYAVQTGTHPRKTTEDNITRYKAQLRQLGLAHDERRSFATTDVEFYRWTQWIFLQIYNAWYDSAAEKARPIAELEAEFAAGTRPTPDGRAWADLTRVEQRTVVDGYRLAYISEAPVNWCPGLGTVLANEEVTADGRSDRGNFPVFRRNLKQWMMRITAYSDRLVADLDRLDWPDSVKAMQRNWIGRSEGAQVRFPITGVESPIEVFTTRPDTLFGATYMVLAPEHPLVDAIAPEQWPADVDSRWTGGAATPREAVAAYRAAAGRKSDLDRQENRDKTGVFTGAYATNPVNGEQIPVFVADYVLMGYGTGAIMAVPAQDQRDWDFATAFGLPIVRTVQPSDGFDGEAFTGDGPAINSANDEISLNSLGVTEAKRAIIDWLVEKGAGESVTHYKLRDWLFSRQRYWGEPFPVVWDEDGMPVALPEDQLPVELPEIDDYAPTAHDPDDANSEPEPPLSRNEEWVNADLDLGSGVQHYRRETNTMPQWAGSCWYYLRYLDPKNTERFVDREVEEYWLGKDPSRENDPGGVDLYVGGVEHAVLHLLYSRFWHKVLYDLGHVSSEEPFRRLFNQGYIQAFAYTDARGTYVPAEEVTGDEASGFTWNNQPVKREYGKMGKSLKNVVTPDEMSERYGADTFRLYEMSTGPMDVSRPWSTRDVVGSQRFLQRVWRNLVDERTGEIRVTDAEPDVDTLRALHKAIAGVHADYVALHYNTAAAKLIELNNYLTKVYGVVGVPRSVAEPLVLMMAPLTPHIAEELWTRLGHEGSLAHGPFPVADEQYLVADTVEYPIQVNGKVRSRITVAADADQDAVKAAVLADEKVVAALDGKEPRKLIVVPGRLVNVVV